MTTTSAVLAVLITAVALYWIGVACAATAYCEIGASRRCEAQGRLAPASSLTIWSLEANGAVASPGRARQEPAGSLFRRAGYLGLGGFTNWRANPTSPGCAASREH